MADKKTQNSQYDSAYDQTQSDETQAFKSESSAPQVDAVSSAVIKNDEMGAKPWAIYQNDFAVARYGSEEEAVTNLARFTDEESN